MGHITRTQRAWKIKDGHATIFEDTVVVESPLTIYLDEEEFVTLVCTPDSLEELVVGFLASEGLIRTADDVVSLTFDSRDSIAYVKLRHKDRPERTMFGRRILSSCCGRSRTSFYFFNDARTARSVQTAWSVPASLCFDAMAALQERSAAFHITGGIHNAALATPDGNMLAMRSDIGRHNALDKLYGWALRSGQDLAHTMIVFSGRVSSEVLLKISKMGVPILLSKSAPTDLALRMADDLGITVVGFLRGRHMNVYTHPERIAEPIPESNRS
ncbi:MAG: formate dehydrogenase accessory sulfurtransferase FdhD [Alicyclobacillaceae bacterium]|nr:formate dehydrogenase accessory sulfurtransferase FdhD [Alicyclobacillaceae bacterium]